FLRVVRAHSAVEHWLFWSYAGYWALTLAWGAACLSSGDAVVRRLLPDLPVRERLLSDFAAGILVFFLGTFVIGLLGLYGPAYFVGFPLVLAISGGRGFLRFLRNAAARFLAVARRRSPTPLSLCLHLFGLACLALAYFGILTPGNIAADSHWYHLP